MMILLQGDTPGGIDSRLWIYLIFAALSVIGGLLGKKKKDETEAAKRRQQGLRTPQARPRQPTPPRVPQTPRPARPSPQLPPIEARRPQTSVAAPPMARRQPPRPVLARPRPVQARPGQGAEPGVIVDVSTQPEALVAEVVEEASAVEPVAAVPAVPPARAASVGRAAGPRPSAEAEQVRRLLQDTSGLRSAFILSEILAPPVALRENLRVRDEIGG